MKLAIASRADRPEHGPCHRCGWTLDVTRMSRKHAHELGVPPHTTLCDECLTDLRRRLPVTAAIDIGSQPKVEVSHQRRSVA